MEPPSSKRAEVPKIVCSSINQLILGVFVNRGEECCAMRYKRLEYSVRKSEISFLLPLKDLDSRDISGSESTPLEELVVVNSSQISHG